MTKSALLLSIFFLPIATAYSDDGQIHLNPGTAQLGAPVTLFPHETLPETFYKSQRTTDDRLILTPDEAFFPKLGLNAVGTAHVPDPETLNGGKSFIRVKDWDEGDVAEWGIFLTKPGDVNVAVQMTSFAPGRKFKLQLGDTTHTFSTKTSPQAALEVMSKTMKADRGFQTVRLVCTGPQKNASLLRIIISGPPVRGGAVIRKRWRPAAAHTKFSSSEASDNIRLWVMEMDAVPGDLGFYCPITTPFGYYGPTWKADGTVNSSFNFSLWSYGRGKKEPPIEQLSHLLAIGNRDAKFSGFGHEGTGVKIRGWEPLAGRTGQRQAIALRVEPGPKYETYYSYYYLADEKRWRLFGVGNKFNNGKPLKSLTVGSFVEVPGPPHVQRTGPYERTMRYRGWVMDEQENWFPLDRMKRGNVDKETGLTHTDRGVTDDGWFYLQTGGWTFRKAPKDGFVELPTSSVHEQPAYLNSESVIFLKSVPSEIKITHAERAARSVQGTFNVKNVGRNAKVAVYWGNNEGLTFADRWQHHNMLSGIEDGENSFRIEAINESESVFIRLLLTNDDGQFWTLKSCTK